MRALLISTYELGRQPFGIASPAAWLRGAGIEVCCLDLSRQALDESAVRSADLITFYVPMHTATRLAVAALPAVREMNPRAHLCFYGLYAPVNEPYLRKLGAQTIIGGEFEAQLAALACRIRAGREGSNGHAAEAGGPRRGDSGASICLDRLDFVTPDREGLPSLGQYAQLILPDGTRRTTGYTEASRGCKHLCRHCPVVPVYNGVFRVIPRAIVLEDIRCQVAGGAEHVTFGDPDFFNGIGHALPLVEALHQEFPQLTYDVTIKVEHLLKHRDALAVLRRTGCLFITSAAESVDDAVLARLEKHHTRADLSEAIGLCREAGLILQPTFIPFTPWTTLEGYLDLLRFIRARDLIESVAPIQLAIRLLVPAGSRLLELAETCEFLESFDEAALVYPWRHPDRRVDDLCAQLQRIVETGEKQKLRRAEIFARVERAALGAAGRRRRASEDNPAAGALPILPSRATIPYLNEPWYC